MKQKQAALIETAQEIFKLRHIAIKHVDIAIKIVVRSPLSKQCNAYFGWLLFVSLKIDYRGHFCESMT